MVYKDYLSDTELKNLNQILISEDYLFYGLKNKQENSVFKRTFTSLMIAMLFLIPNKEVVLSSQELKRLYQAYLEYLKHEYDYRGYVTHKGWAHFFAHSSDVLRQFLKSQLLQMSG
ncbi:MAG: DUF2785 domain-containing protein [Candidatus Izemoplasma sp.]|nr:DUF2785 domain-containing protein [Candidatus Izemoplasma sp.]